MYNVLNPVCEILKKNSKTVNMFLMVLFIVAQLPIDSTFGTKIQGQVLDGIKSVSNNMVFKLLSLVLLYCMYLNGDVLMMVLFLANTRHEANIFTLN